MVAANAAPIRVGLALAVALGGCGFDIPPIGYVNTTEIATIRTQVVELGALDPGREGPLLSYADETPIAEVLPGDRVMFEALVVDVDGQLLPADELDSLWVQCGANSCLWLFDLSHPILDTPCALPSHQTDSLCQAARGDGRVELEIPPLGYLTLTQQRIHYYGVIAWNGRSAEDCWEYRRRDSSDLHDCGFVHHELLVGPSWWLLAYADQLPGFPCSLCGLEPVPPLLFEQRSNRAPRAPVIGVRVDGQLRASDRPPLPIIAVEPGATIELELSFDYLSQVLQSYFVARGETIVLQPEQLISRVLTTNAIRTVGRDAYDGNQIFDDGSIVLAVDDDAEPGSSRVLVVYRDERGGSGITSVEFEVR